MPRLTNPAPRLANKRLAALYSVMAAGWFVAWACISLLWQVTLIDAGQVMRIAGSVALVLSISRKRLHLDGWSSFVFGFFGLVPLSLVLFLAINYAFGPVEEQHLAIVAVESRNGSTTRHALLEGDAYEQEGDRVRRFPQDPSAWYLATLHLRLRRGVLGFTVVLDRSWVPSSEHRLLPEVHR